MTHTIFIDGAVGTTGLEIAERLSGRSEFQQIILPEDKRKDVAARREALNDADFVIMCLPDEASKEADGLMYPVNYTVWIPPGAESLRGGRFEGDDAGLGGASQEVA